MGSEIMFNWPWAGSQSDDTLPDIFPIPISQEDFVSIDVQNIYSRILTDVLYRTEGIPKEKQKLLWDNCLASEHKEGLVTLLSGAMTDKKELFLVYHKETQVIRKATDKEQEQIKEDYSKKGESSVGVYITFGKYKKTDMIKFYSALEYCSVGGLYKQSNVSKSIQLKFNDMRSSTGLSDAANVKTQAKALAKGLAEGKAVSLDAKDIIELAKVDMTATQTAIEFIAGKQSFYLGLPASWINGDVQKSLGDSGKADSKAVERGLKPYYFSIIQPVIDALLSVSTSFKSEDFELLTTANETLKTFELTSDELLSRDNKTKIINRTYGLPEDQKGDPPKKVETALANIPGKPAEPNPPPPKE